MIFCLNLIFSIFCPDIFFLWFILHLHRASYWEGIWRIFGFFFCFLHLLYYSKHLLDFIPSQVELKEVRSIIQINEA